MFVHSKMKIFILASVLFLISFSGCTYENESESNRTKFEYKDFNFREHLNSPEHMRRKLIMHQERSFIAALSRYTQLTQHEAALVPVCNAFVMSHNEVLIIKEDCPTDLDQIVLTYKCHLRDQNDRATSEFKRLVSFVTKVTPDDDGLSLRLKTTDPNDECIIFTVAESMNGNFPFPCPNSPSSKSPNYDTKRFVVEKMFSEATKTNLKDHDEL